MFITIVLFVVGFIILVKGADMLVSGASSLAARLGVSALVIGLTIVAFGTSAPELIVNLLASLQGNTDIAIGNILGSNIVNILLILGICAVMYPLSVGKGTTWKEIPFALLAVVMLGCLALDQMLGGAESSLISFGDGLVLIGFFAIFLYYIFSIAKEDAGQMESVKTDAVPAQSLVRSVTLIAIGLSGLVIGGKWIVDGAVFFATALGVSESLIGLTIVAVGTSLPELATSVAAVYRRNIDIAVGNIVGSNIFNIFWILGVSAVITPLPFSEQFTIDLLVTFGATLLLFLVLFVGRKHTIERWQGVLFIVLYVAYVAYLIGRG
ncbi:calcium/sodium antiporter [Patescibacteria group bacterium]|nr:calcium/sodium antiporter [Patescibacteria group bacterium]